MESIRSKENVLTLSGRFASSSPKGGASDETIHFAWTAKASPFGRGGIASAMTERVSRVESINEYSDKLLFVQYR